MKTWLLMSLLALAACAPSNGAERFPEAGRTYLTVSAPHGVQIEYLTADKAWLWYPGNGRVVEGSWRIAASRPVLICWTYEVGSFNRITRTPGGREGCEALGDSASRVRASLEGDVFSLRSGEVPSRRGRCEVPPPFDVDVSDVCR